MAETFDNQTFAVGNSTTGVLLGNPLTNTTTFTGTNLVSGLTGVAIDGTIDQPGSSVQVALNVGGVAQASVPGTYRGFTQASPNAEPIYYFDTTVAGIGTPVTVAVSAGPVPLLSAAAPINTTNVTAPDSPLIVCFVTGTQIRTSRGEVAVEDLQIGDLAVTSSGEQRPIRWIGHQTINCSRHSDPSSVLPVRIAAGAFGDNKPERDLLVSPGHAICLDVLGELLFPASALVNSSTITQEQVEQVTYWHVELDSHDILIANGQPAESYLDVGNRSFFAGENVVNPFALPDARVVAEPAYCRPCFSSGALVQAVHTRMRERALALGWSLVEEPLARLHLVVDGRVIQPDSEGHTARFIVPADAQDVRLVSSTGVPKHVGDNDDGRTLGVCLKSLTIEDGLTMHREVALDDPHLSDGFHMAEEGRRWTSGEAHLPRELWQGSRGHFFLRLTLACPPLPRWKAPEAKAKAVEPHWHGLQLVKAA